MNTTTATRKRRTEETANIVSMSINITVPHTLPSSSLKLAWKLEPAQVALESLPRYLQDHITDHTSTMINMFNDVKKKKVGLSKFNENRKQERSEHTNLSEEHKNPLSGLKAVKVTETYEQFERIFMLLRQVGMFRSFLFSI